MMWKAKTLQALFVLFFRSYFTSKNKSFALNVVFVVIVEASELTLVHDPRSVERFRSPVHSLKVSKNLEEGDRTKEGVVHHHHHNRSLQHRQQISRRDKQDLYQRKLELELVSRATTTSTIYNDKRNHGNGGGGATISRALAATLDTNTPSFETHDCKNQEHYYDDHGNRWPPNCTLIVNTTEKVNTMDPAVNEAHNYAIDAYTFYKNMFNLNSFDGLGMPVRSYVHYGVNNSEILFSFSMQGLRYGDGFVSYEKWTCYDAVAIAYTLGVDYFSAGFYLSGNYVLSGAMSEIMTAAMARLVHKRGQRETWRLFADCDLDPSDGLGFWDLADPLEFGLPNHYDGRYDEYYDSAIIDHWFFLMVSGGVHSYSKIQVPALDPLDFDASLTAGVKIVYQAWNSKCFSANADFFDARVCTLLYANGSKQLESVVQAWGAVGIGMPTRPLSNQVPVTNLSLIADDVLLFVMKESVTAGMEVTCTLQGPNGDADLYVKFGEFMVGGSDCPNCDCFSQLKGTNERCTTDYARLDTNVYITVRAVQATTNMSLECRIHEAPSASPSRMPSVKPSHMPSATPSVVPSAMPTATVITPLSSKVTKGNISAFEGQKRYFVLNETVPAGVKVTCMLEAPNGDADLYVKFGIPAEGEHDSCDCGSNEKGVYDEDCTTENAPNNATAYITVLGSKPSSNMTLECFINKKNCKSEKRTCRRTSDCCGTMVCDGPENRTKTCKKCKRPPPCDPVLTRCAGTTKSCKRTSQCCRHHACTGPETNKVCQKKS